MIDQPEVAYAKFADSELIGVAHTSHATIAAWNAARRLTLEEVAKHFEASNRELQSPEVAEEIRDMIVPA